MVKDTTIKISENDVMILNELKTEYRREGKKVSQKELLHRGVMLLVKNKHEIKKNILKDNTKEMTKKFLKGKKYDFEPNWMDEMDTAQ